MKQSSIAVASFFSCWSGLLLREPENSIREQRRRRSTISTSGRTTRARCISPTGSARSRALPRQGPENGIGQGAGTGIRSSRRGRTRHTSACRRRGSGGQGEWQQRMQEWKKRLANAEKRASGAGAGTERDHACLGFDRTGAAGKPDQGRGDRAADEGSADGDRYCEEHDQERSFPKKPGRRACRPDGCRE